MDGRRIRPHKMQWSSLGVNDDNDTPSLVFCSYRGGYVFQSFLGFFGFATDQPCPCGSPSRGTLVPLVPFCAPEELPSHPKGLWKKLPLVPSWRIRDFNDTGKSLSHPWVWNPPPAEDHEYVCPRSRPSPTTPAGGGLNDPLKTLHSDITKVRQGAPRGP